MNTFKKIIGTILVLAFVLNHTALAVNGIQNEIKQNTQEQRVQNTQDNSQNNNENNGQTQTPEEPKLESDKYIIVEEENQIRRVLPQTQIGVLKKKFNMPSSAVKVYKDETCKEEVTSGDVATGMVLTYEGGSKKYTILVIGDFNQDGKMGEIELNLLIKHIVGLKENQLQGINKITGDINGDGKINQVDITVLIRWIVYKEIDIPENKTPGAPEIQVVAGGDEKEGWYKQNVTLKILEDVNTGIKVDKTTYQINKEKETKIENGGSILLEEEGIYEITAYTYSENGAKSKAAKKTIRIEKKIEKLEAQTSSKTSKITTKVEAKSLSGIKEYTYFLGIIQEDGKISYGEGVTVKEPEYTFDKLTQNTQYGIKIEAVTIAGNAKQIEVKETTKKMVEVQKQDFTITKDPSTWTKEHVTLTINVEDTINEKEDYQIAYSTDEGQNWKIYTNEEKANIEQNGQVQIRLTDGTNHSNSIIEVVENIDKTNPEGTLKVTERKTDKITVEVEAQDSQSGMKGYRYFLGTKNQQEEISYEAKSEITEETTFAYKGLKASITYYVKVEIIDKVGNIAEIIKEETTKDMPQVGENQIRLEYSNTKWTNQDVIVSILADEQLSIGECKIEYSLDDGKTWTPDNKQDIVIKENTNIIVKITDGTNDVVVASGKVGNIDKQKPEGKIEETHTTKSIKAVVEAADNLSGIKGYTYYLGVQNDQIDGIEYTKKTEQVQDTEYTYENLKQDTTYYINVEIEDNAGNILTIEKEVKTEKVPDLNDSNIKTEVSETEWTKQDVILTAFLEENLDTKGCYLEYSLDGGKNWAQYNQETKIVVEHNTIVQIRLTDGLNHGQEVRVEITNIDKLAPEIINIAVDKTSRTITVKVTATDTLSGIASYTYYLGTKNEQTEEIEYVEMAETEKTSYKYQDLMQDTTYYIKVEVTDNIGNIAESTKEEKTIKIPDAAEYISMTPNTKKWTNQDVTVTITYEENPYEVEYSVDGENWTACENGQEVIIEENKTVYSRLTDGLNHSKEASLAIENIDKQLPQVVNFQNKEIYSDGVTLEVEAADNLSGISSITWYYKKEAEESYKREVKTYVPEGELEAGGLELTEAKEYRKLEKGTYEFYADICDVAGNRVQTEVRKVVLKTVDDLNSGNVVFSYMPSTWTNGNVEVRISTTVEEYTLEYSIDGENWQEGKKVNMEKNGDVYARLTDGTNVGEYITGRIENIDKTKPEVGTIEIDERTSQKLTVSVEMQDKESGLGRIDWYYRKVTDANYTKQTEELKQLNGSEKGDTTKQTKTFTLDNIESGTYLIYAEVYDVAGNKIGTQIATTQTDKVPDAKKALEMTPSTTNWTNQDVTVEISNKADVSLDGTYQIQYSKNAKDWTNGNIVTMTGNGTVYARLTDGENIGEMASLTIVNIDKTMPEVDEIVIKEITTHGFTLEIELQDKVSGLGKIDWFYKKDTQTEYQKKTEEYQTVGGDVVGQRSKTKKTVTIESLPNGTYDIYADIYDVAGNKVATQKVSAKLKWVSDLTTANTTFKITPSTWTNQDVTVEIITTVTESMMQYSFDGNNWSNGNTVTMSGNGVIYARLTDGENIGGSISANITNIDKQPAAIGKLQVASKTSKELIVSLEVEDVLSGLGKIDWYYKKAEDASYTKKTDEYTTLNGSAKGDTTKQTKTLRLSEIDSGTYAVYADVYDVAGNKVVAEVLIAQTEKVPNAIAALTMTPSTTNWTNQNVTVEIRNKQPNNYQIQYSKDANTWTNANTVTMTENGTIYARLTDGRNVGEVATLNLTNIDKTAPATSELTKEQVTSKSFNTKIEVEDTLSGLGKIDWFYKKAADTSYTKKTEEYTPLNGNQTGVINKQEKRLSLNNLTSGNYEVYADIYDVAGNKVTKQVLTVQTDNVPDAKASLTIIPSTTNWTNQNVVVNITKTASNYDVQYSKDGNTWTNGTSVSMTENGTVYARLTDGTNVGEVASLSLTNIDKTAVVAAELKQEQVTSKSFVTKVEMQDALSGLGKIDWFYKKAADASYTKKTEEYTPLNGNQTGTTTKQEKTLSLNDLTSGTYDIYADIYDVAGNKKQTAVKKVTLTKVTDLMAANTTFKVTPTTWTNQDVTVEITTTQAGYEMQYSKDGSNWSNGNVVTVEKNGSIYARLTDGKNTGGSLSKEITNIDKQEPTVGKLETTTKTSKAITVSLEVEDTLSGLGKIDWYYKKAEDTSYTKKTDEYTPLNGTAKGDTTKQTKTLSLSNMASGTYAIYADVYDVAGNKKTTESLVTQTDMIPNGIAALTMTPSTTNWTNQNVTVTITRTQSNYTVQYSKDGNTWTTGTSVSMSGNGTVYARLTDGLNVGEVASLSITNIDKTLPTTEAITTKETTTEGFTVSSQVQDASSGLGKIDWFYKLKTAASYTKKTAEYQTIGGTATGDQSKVEKSVAIENLPYGTYQIYADIYDVAGNKKTTAVVEITLRKVTDLTTANTTFTVNPTTWTNQDVTVEITTTQAGYEMQYSKDGSNWSNGNVVTVEKNGTVYARLTDGKNTGGSLSQTITNIDKDPAVVGKLETTIKTSKAITVSLEVQDILSGLGKIDWFYKKTTDASYTKKTDSYTALNGAAKGNTTKQTKTLSLNNIASGTYSIYADIYDVAGNKVTTENLITQTDIIPNGQAALTMTPSTTNWTNQNVTVTITRTQSSYTVQYSKDGNTWTNGTSVSMTSNGTVYARLTDGTNIGEIASLSITNIDKTLPTTEAITTKETTTEGFTVSTQVQDASSGLGKIDWFYKLKTAASYTKKTAEYQTIGGTATGDQSRVEKSITIDNLPYGTYQTYADIYDVAGNKKTTAVVEVTLRKVTDLTTANTTFTVNPTTWTNQDVTVEINTTQAGYEMQYSKDGSNWSNGNVVTVEKNGTVYARLTDGKNTGASVNKVITNIDKQVPTVGKLQATTKTSKAITVSLEVQDTLSGLGKIDWYYKKAADASYTKKTESYTALNGTTKGDTTKQTKTLSLSNIQTGTYIVYADVYDVAGNKVTTENLITDTDKVPDGQAALTMTPSTTNWTNQNVTVTITRTQSSYTVQYSKDGSSWTNGTSVSMTGNGTVYARLTDGTNVGEVASLSITNIDKTLPTAGTMTSQNITSNSLGAKVEVQDTLSGLGKIDWYYKKSSAASYTKKTEEYQVIGGSNVGSQVKSVKELSLEKLQQGTYQIYADIYDVAGNKKTSNTITVTTKTIDTLVGNVTFNQNPTTWTKDNVTVSIATSIKDYSLEYSTNGSTWYPYNGPVILQNNGNVYARLTDGVNEGASASLNVTNIDKTAPTIGTVTGSRIVGNTGNITVSQIADSQSGIEAISFSKTAGAYNWEYTSNASYTKTITGASSNGTWYVYARDKVGNISAAKTTTVSGIVDKVTNLNLTTADIELDIGGTKQIEISYTGTAASITYTSTDTSIATVGADGLVKGKQVGTTNITVRAYDYDGTITEKTARVQVKSYKVTYDYITNGGTFGTKTQEEVAYGQNIDLNAAATKEGWEFVGWNTDKSAKTALTTLTMPKGNITVYAIFKKEVGATCYYYNGTTSTSTTVKGTMYNRETSVSVTMPSITSVSKNSLTWAGRGWSTATTGNASINLAAGAKVNISGGERYYASYSTTVTATYNYYSGSAATSSSPTATAYMNYTGTLIGGKPTVPTAPAISGYTQRGWSTSSAYNANIITPGTITANTSYYMSYTNSITVSYNINEGEGTLPDSQSGTGYMTYNGTKTGIQVTMPETGGFTKQHYDVSGWNANTAGTGTNYEVGTTATFTANTTIYVKWTLKGYWAVDNTKYYNSLAEAVTGASSGSTIELLKTYTDPAGEITINKNLTINLSDYTVNRSGERVIISSGSTVTIQGNTNGKLMYPSSIGGYYEAILNQGTLNLEGGTLYNGHNAQFSNKSTVRNDGIFNISGGTVMRRNDGDGRVIVNTKTINMTGGTIDGTCPDGIYNSGTVTMDGGTIIGADIGIAYGNVTINEGTVTGKNRYGIRSDSSDKTITINGGTITGCNGIYSAGTLKINGGTITSTTAEAIIVVSSGTMTMIEGTVTGKTSGISSMTSQTITITGGTVTGSTGINASKGTVTIKNGSVTGTTYGIQYEKEAKVIIGDSGTNLTNTPVIKGTDYGVYATDDRHIFEYYNGNIITDTNKISNAVATYRKTGYMPETILDTETNKYVTSLVSMSSEYNYAIGSTGYTTLTQAIEAWNEGDVITVLRSHTNSEQVTINKNITLNLNNLTLTKSSSPIIVPEGNTFTVKGQGTIKTNSSIHTIENSGTVNVETDIGGKVTNTYSSQAAIKNMGTTNVNSIEESINGSTYGIYNDGEGQINVKEGTVKASTSGIYNNASGVINVIGGNIYGTTQGIYNNSTGLVSVRKGTVDGSSYGIYNNLADSVIEVVNNGTVHATSTAIYLKNGTLNIANGNITYKNSYGVYCSNTSTINMTGGYIEYDDWNNESMRGIQNNGGTININRGTIRGGSYGIYNNSGKITIEHASIENNWYHKSGGSYAAIYNTGSGTVQIDYANIDSAGYGIYNESSGTVTMLKGEVRGDKKNAIQNYGALVLGDKNAAYSATSLQIESHSSYGVYSSTNYEFHNGRIRGTSSTPYTTGKIQFREGYTAGEITKVEIECYWTNCSVTSVYEMTLTPVVSTLTSGAFATLSAMFN